MRTLALSLGNTSLFGGVYEGTRRRTIFRLPMREPLTREELAADLVRAAGGPVPRAVMCSVVPAQTRFVARVVKTRLGASPLLLTADGPHGLTIGYAAPLRLGTDRLAAAIGAQAAFPGRNLVIVDCGTATTVTALRRDGHLLGGAILPGVGVWSEILASRTAQLPPITPRRVRTAIGRSPEAAIASGIFLGHAGAIRELTARIAREAFGLAGKRALVVGTGGNAPLFARENLFTELAPDLILAGLCEFARRFDAADELG